MRSKEKLFLQVICLCFCLLLQLTCSGCALAGYKKVKKDKTQVVKSKAVETKSHKPTRGLKGKKHNQRNLSQQDVDKAARRKTSIIVDARDRKILYAYDADERIYPASLTKVMTLYLLFEAINKKGKITLDSDFRVSAKASAAPPCKLGLKAGDRIKVSDVVNALIVKSANDVALVCAENVAGSEERFVKMMNNKARVFGMNNSHFTNPSGLHHPKQVSTASDMALLALAIKNDFPQFYHLFSQTSFEFRGQSVKGHNRVLANYPGATGLKTGYVARSGFNLITTAKRQGKELLGVVTGGETSAARDATMMSLLDEYFGVVKTKQVKPKQAKQSTKK
ncbi:D-alanyl-D-alanine carboxypeptidase [Rickettsiales endosymbiont of Paramecium tredecaurelia]|uniref:D-alanyl-D-alanine carboxypeptidase family protein n=1 Tax=Candidatus Sarmatiella mevalonica TaxID=2770581 RepID=UPI0019222F77|nr:D-alanyl-D-alanine carboxypeptidase family protein [Candidatus Sarmatiella mevalonica]MBL3284223.1 D-alanyl-D-alanine carboxypeptidase [Candidatus Sarmatiella mevalonica]